ncbi:right-handed parallel beta-helix repeat-containing protein, partial [Candidatus Micrarchaeota archaeon]|nr:right-handed parallel beta-helix repeat-containing protein [Candidatus Micrarchaeota archaeon]
MRSNIYIMLMLVLAISGFSSAQYTFGPGDPLNDCSNPAFGTIVIDGFVNPAGTYTWAGAPGIMAYNNAGGPSPNGFNCIDVLVSDVTIDCVYNQIDGSMNGPGGMGDIGIYIAPGVDNVTITRCMVSDFGWGSLGFGFRNDVGNVFVDGSTNIVIDDDFLLYTGASPAMGDQITYDSATATSGLTVTGGTIIQGAIGFTADNASGIGARTNAGAARAAPVSNVTIENSVSIMSNDGYGVRIDGNNILIRDSTVSGNGIHGILLIGNNDVVRNNTISNNVDMGVRVNDAAIVTIESNAITNNEDEGIFIDNGTSVDILNNVMDGNGVIGNDEGIYVTISDTINIDENNVSNSGDSGIETLNSMNVAIGQNYVFDNDDQGIYVSGCGGALVDANVVYGNNDDGIYILNSEDATVTGNTAYSNGDSAALDSGIRLNSANRTVVENNDVYLNDQHGLRVQSSHNVTADDNYIYNNTYRGIYFTLSDDAVISDNSIYNNGRIGAYIDDSDNGNFNGNEIYNNGLSGTYDGIYFTGLCDIWTLDPNYIWGNTGYGLRIDGTGFTVVDMYIYGQTDFLRLDAAADVDFTNLWLGFDDTYGASWTKTISGVQTRINNANFLIDHDFVSLDSSDSNAQALNDTANVTLNTTGCGNIKYYVLDGFPPDRNTIVTTGTTFTPAYSRCIGTTATFSVASFSGYAVNGTRIILSGGGGAKAKPLNVYYELVCPGNELVITAKSSDLPVEGVMISISGEGMSDSDETDSDGEASFIVSTAGVYNIDGSKSGHETDER